VRRLYVICGQSGVGKSTVVAQVAEGRQSLTIVNFGERIFAMALENALVTDPGDLRLMRPEILTMLQIQVAEHIRELTGLVILDMHLTVHTPAGYIAGMPKQIMNMLQPARIILLEADPYEILKRRMTGKETKGDDESLKEIQEHADLDRAAAISIAIDIGTPVKILRNDDVAKTAEKVKKLLEDDTT